ncbi:MAG: phage tail tip lysozyme [Coriobacteriaceae bacterium]|nr:phage tail tip lysozyme [Coriobacteriaceae bacterium]
MAGSPLIKVRHDGAKALAKPRGPSRLMRVGPLAPRPDVGPGTAPALPGAVVRAGLPLANTRRVLAEQAREVVRESLGDVAADIPGAAKGVARGAVKAGLFGLARGARAMTAEAAGADPTQDDVVDSIAERLSPERVGAVAKGSWDLASPRQRAQRTQERLDRSATRSLRAMRRDDRGMQFAYDRALAMYQDGVAVGSPHVAHERKDSLRHCARGTAKAERRMADLGVGESRRAVRVRRRRARVERVLSRIDPTRAALVLAGLALLLTLSFSMQAVASSALSAAGKAVYDQQSATTIEGVEAEIVNALKAAGLNDVQVAAVVGNLYGESSLDPTATANFDGVFNYAYERAYGLFQFTDAGSSPSSLVVRRMSDFFDWCDAEGRQRSSAGAQAEYWAGGYRLDWSVGLHGSGYYASHASEYRDRDVSLSSWDSTDDVRFATYMFYACNGRGVPCDMSARYQKAEEVYQALKSGRYGTGEEFASASAVQQAIAQATTSTTANGRGWCAQWVSNCYAKAGVSVGGNANDMFWAFCKSSDRSQLRVGMIVGTYKSAATGDGAQFGHVGIYIGDGRVSSWTTRGGVTRVYTDSLDDFISMYGRYAPVRWGFPPAVQE